MWGILYDVVWHGNETNNFTGAITTNAALDREAMDTYIYTYQVIDNGQPPQPKRSAHVNVTITIDDMNDNAPQLGSSSYTGEILSCFVYFWLRQLQA